MSGSDRDEGDDEQVGRIDRQVTSARRDEEGRLTRWFLLTGRRMVVSASLLVFILAVLVGLSVLRPIDVRVLLAETSTTENLFNTLLSGTILLVSIVVSINSVVLSQEITDIESQRDRVDASIKYRKRLGELVEEEITPARPAEFLRVILHVVFERTQRLQNLAAEQGDEDLQHDIEPFVTDVFVQVGRARTTLSDTRSGTFGVLLVGLNYDHSEQLRALRMLDRTYRDDLTEEQRAVVDDLVETLKYLAIGREYFKSIYYKQELARLSSRILYVSLPSIVFISYVILSLDTDLLPDVMMFTLTPLLLFVLLAYTVALAPYIVLTSYILRASTITLRTVAAGPFILQSGPQDTDRETIEHALDWEAFEDEEE
ncbi:hypothetical protein BV210_15150 [Halorientalis sp. IM1011]|uniref:hypothetical protein n=1 Tax=Halorientalis sp. IM1011 TaxID=1932360 RepID=UPI00097CC3CD|nr:hypothetical protein [Halorientalis sp. IM1011]AQL44581.1 hypothetical protein BV210_15150 [Halorientalis sp. IM1011]